ncbi:hypothetical protein CGCF415_v008279 [Colletotrichum fructicola]|nr:hypothetical protein CGCF415_v008279 [Colletotrichum fructicola]KAF4935387.1 hypothetical protein CGCF245_v007691 [Colletotrichum fructicola]KAF5488377.1 hypothetical protein CGCF413_v012314 [Colletotrichum fructicola]
MAPTGASSISELYKSYKKLTNCFLSWLWCQHRLKASSDCSLNFRSTIDILKTAKVLQKAKTTVPTSVIGFLRSAIDKRKLVAGIYQHFGADHDGHDAFNDRLEEVLSILTPLMEVLPAPLMDTPDAENLASYNRFSHLPTVESEPDDQNVSVETGHKHSGSPLSSSHTTNQANKSDPPSDFYLEDDHIRELFDAAYFLIELDRVYTLVKKCWADASRGNIPFPLATWMTNFAFNSISKGMPPKFVHVCVNMSIHPESTCEFFSKLSDKVDPKTFLSDARRFYMLAQTVNDYGKTLCDAPKLNINIRSCMKDDPNCECKFRTSHDDLPTGGLNGEELSESEKATIRFVFNIARADIETPRAISMLEGLDYLKPSKCTCYTQICDTFFAMARWFFLQNELLATSRLVAGLNVYFLVEKSVTASDIIIPRSHYRSMSHNLAVDMRRSVNQVLGTVNVMAPNCEDATMWQCLLLELCDGLTAYISEEKFDTYHTSPWTAGSEMLEMLNVAFDYGFRINSNWAVISATLHLYNAMRRSIADTPRLPVFEELSQTLLSSVFGGNLPERNFCSIFRRIVYDSRVEKTDVPRGKGKAYRLEAGLLQLPCWMDIQCRLLDRHDWNYNDSIPFQGDVLGIPCPSATREKAFHKITDARAKLTLTEYLEKVKDMVSLDIEGPHPIARTNLFDVFTLCSKFLSKLGSLGKSRIPKDVWSSFARAQLRNGLVVGRCDAEFLMEAIDECPDTRQGRRILEKLWLTRNAIQAFKEIDPETTLSQYMWNI